MSTTMTETRTRTRGWTPAVLPLAVLLMALGAWVFLAPLVGPYFSFGLDTPHRWQFSSDHWTLSLLPGIAIFVGGLMMAIPSRFSGWLAGLISVAGGVWLVIGPSLHATWSSHTFQPLPGSDWMTAARWIGDLYGAGALAIYLGALAQGMLMRSSTVVVRRPVAEPAVVDRERAADAEAGDATIVRRPADAPTVVERPAADGTSRVERT